MTINYLFIHYSNSIISIAVQFCTLLKIKNLPFIIYHKQIWRNFLALEANLSLMMKGTHMFVILSRIAPREKQGWCFEYCKYNQQSQVTIHSIIIENAINYRP